MKYTIGTKLIETDKKFDGVWEVIDYDMTWEEYDSVKIRCLKNRDSNITGQETSFTIANINEMVYNGSLTVEPPQTLPEDLFTL